MTAEAAGKIKLLKQPENMGVAAARNTGMDAAEGAYISFVDSDDMLVPNALEILYDISRTLDADVVHTGMWYELPGDGSAMKAGTQEMCPPVKEITWLPRQLPERIQEWITSAVLASVWGKLFRRRFLVEHGIRFHEEVYYGEDALFVFQVVCLTERMVRIPDIVYIYRQNMLSVTHQPPDAARLERDADNLVRVIRILSQFMQTLEFCRSNVQVQFLVLDYWFRVLSNRSKEVYKTIPPSKLYSALYSGLQPVFGEHTAMVVCLYQSAHAYRGGCLQILGCRGGDPGNLWMPELGNLANRMKKDESVLGKIRAAVQ